MLNIQYRMRDPISQWPSCSFYNGKLFTGTTAECNWIEPLQFHQCFGEEEKQGSSYLNKQEATRCVELIRFIVAHKKPDHQIGLITPYTAQRKYIMKLILSEPALGKIEVSSVDAFQGREAEFILVSCVRSNMAGNVGFLECPRRTCVQNTRAKLAFLIVGNAQTLSNNKMWRNLLLHINQQGKVFAPEDPRAVLQSTQARNSYDEHGLLEVDWIGEVPIEENAPLVDQVDQVDQDEDMGS